METAASRFDGMTGMRDAYLRRARACAALTIPYLMPPIGYNGNTLLPTPYQSVGARGVNNLSSKMLKALLPASASIFRFVIDDEAVAQLDQNGDMRGKVEEALGSIERAGAKEIEDSGLHCIAAEGFKQLLVAGNVLLHVPMDKTKPRMFRLDHYCVRRSPDGTPLEIIVKEEVAREELPLDVQKELPQDAPAGSEQTQDNLNSKFDLYTYIRRGEKQYEIHQEVNGNIIEGSKGTTPLDTPEWLPLRFFRVDGEHYGRSYVEEYMGDLRSLEGLEKSIVYGAAAMAKVLFLVNPGGTTSKKDISTAPNGAVRSGKASDISVMQVEKFADFRVAMEKASSLEQRLNLSFLVNSAVQRQAERVTAAEIRFMAQELEEGLGGIYSLLSQEFQKPLVNVVLMRMRRQKKMPKLPSEAVNPVVVTGMEALARGQELERLHQLVALLAGTLPKALEELDPREYVRRVGTALSVDLKGLLLTSEQKAQAAQAQATKQAMQTMLEKGTAPAVQQAGGMLKDSVAAAQGQQAPPTK